MATVGSRSPLAAEPEALKHSFSYLVDSIHTAALLPAALSRNLITHRQRTECSHEAHTYMKAEKFVSYLQRAVNDNNYKFYTFVQILQETGQAQIASRLRDELTHSIRSMQQPSASSSTDEGKQIELADGLVEELTALRFAFANLLYQYKNQLHNSPEAQEVFVKFLPRLFHKAVGDHSFQSHFNTLIEEEISLFNTHYLKRICTIFPEAVCAATRKLVDEYEQQRQHFVASTTVSQFKQLLPATATPSKLLIGKVPIKLKLKNYWGYKTLDDLIKLVNKFGVSGCAFHLSKVEDGCCTCIAVIWLYSTTEVKQLKMVLSEIAGSLQTMGVLQVFIGEEELVLECSHSTPTEYSIRKQVTIGVEYLCPICTEPLTEPYLSIECGHHHCRQCRDRLLSIGKTECPTCREPDVLMNAVLDKHLQRLVRSVKVRCSYYQEGCEWVGELRDLHDHLDPAMGGCSGSIACPFGCGKYGRRSEMRDHTCAYYDAKKSLGVSVTMEITNIGTQGYPGVGKTSVLDLAMGKEPAPTRTSTDCVDPPSRYLMVDSADSVGIMWKNVTTEKMFEMVCEAMKKTIDENLSESDQPTVIASQSTSDTEQATATEQISPANSSIQTPDLDLNSSTIDSSPGALDSSPDFSTQPFPNVSPYSGFTDVFPELLKELFTSKSSDVIFNSHWMMVTDCGGQPPFLDAAALFLRNSCLQIFPVKLNEPLTKIPEFLYFYKGVRASFDEDCVPLTHKQIIETLAKSVASIQPPHTPSATKCPKGAKFTIVGTFKDEAHKCSESVEEKETILKEVLEPYKQFQVQLGKKVILPVNAIAIDTETKKERTESAKDLGDLLRKSALDVSMKINMKLRWFGLLLSLLIIAEDDHKAVLTLDECYKLGKSLGMDKSETRKAIQFFHDISLIMHFNCPKLRDSVIINTKPVLNKLSRIISVSFLDEKFLANHYKIVLPSGAKELLQYHGRFNRDTLEKCTKFTEPITLQFFLDILEHVKIAVAIDKESATNKESEYFMPCALSYAPEASVSEPSPPWVIRLRVRRGDKDVYIPIPVGYLPAEVVFLLTEFSSHFSTDRCHRQYRNMIKLRYKRGGFVYLIERHLQLEIYFSFCKQLPQDCATIRNHVLKSIRLAEEKLHIIQEGEGAITKVDSFLCSCGKGSAHHTCAYNPLSGILECEESEETGESCKLDPQHLLWLENVPEFYYTSSASCQQRLVQVEGLGTLNHPLSEAHLAIIAARIDDWRAISPSLGLTAADDSAILGKVPNSVHAQRVSMLRKWKQILGKRATYEKLRQVFGQCRRTDLVEIVQQFVSSEENSAKPIATIHQLSVTEQEQAATESAYEDEVPPPRKKNKQGNNLPTAPPEATSEIVPESSQTNSASDITQSTAAKDSPTVKQLVKAVASVSDWSTLGLYLGLQPAVLTDIHTTHHVQGLNTLKMVMFDKWLNKCPRASWDDVIEALTDMGENTAADQVKAGRPKKPLPETDTCDDEGPPKIKHKQD